MSSKPSPGSTLSHLPNRQQTQRLSAQPHLFLVFQSDHPLAPSVRFSLREIEELDFGRGAEGDGARLEKVGPGHFKMTVPDRWLSSSHAALRREAAQWLIVDKGSKNGTMVNGQRCERAVLADGDLMELGHTFFIFRDAMLGPIEGPASLTAGELRAIAPGIATLVPALAEEFGDLEAIAPSLVSVVIHGESGTGKELVARALHALSGRAGAFVAVNCAALSKTLVESELFGYRKGAFSGATEDRPGLIRSADGGTLFLDEIGDLPASAQAAFLRVLQEGEVLPVGGTRPVEVNIRVLAATHRDLEALVEEKQFRADLMARISGVTLSMLPLRQRREDLGILIGTLLRRHFPQRAEQIAFSSDAARALLLYPWPLNVRELEKCLSAAVVLSRGEMVQLTHLPGAVRASLEVPEERDSDQAHDEDVAESSENAPLSESDQRQREQIVALLREHGGNITAVARAMGKARFQLQRWIKRYRIDTKNFRR